ncbi:MAG: alpha-L-fucosidase, partial [Anaerolineae bacterium]
QYGKLDIMWYDGPGPYIAEGWQVEDIPAIWRAAELDAMVRALQPDIIINNRTLLPGDFDTPEQHITPSGRMWESCMTMNDHWGYTAADDNWKSARELVRQLVQCVSGGGNYLLNVGPDRDGVIPQPAVERLQAVGHWLEGNGDSIYGAGSCPISWATPGLLTAKSARVYVHCFYWSGSEICIGGFGNAVQRASFLASGERIAFEQRRDRLFLKNLPTKMPDPIDTVILLEMDGAPRTVTDQSMVAHL